ncbi:MAG: hypothetical protein M3O88_09335 [Actinomycetota bacterium]|jgi:hypothetical protein|nr:hypothetical protein [Actinomycetota bacterium]
MADWVTISSLATAGGTLVLAIATFGSVRSANRAARVAEQGFLLGQRPLLMPSRLDDPTEKVMWVDEHWAHIDGGKASVELVDGNVYLAMSLRSVGNGTAVLQGWRPSSQRLNANAGMSDPESFRPQGRDLYVPSGDIGFWQAAIRDAADPEYPGLSEAISERRIFTVELLYSDHEGGQRAIGRFVLAPGEAEQWICSVARHWNLDRPNPR